MRKLILFMHASLDGFVAELNGEMDWIQTEGEMFEYANKQTALADTALYGRVTFGMMDAYWPTAADQPNATKHDVDHSRWYKGVNKIVVSTTLPGSNDPKVTILASNIPAEIQKLKQQSGKNILMFGSPSTAHTFMHHDLIDDYFILVNPILLGKGILLFKDINRKMPLKRVATKEFRGGVVAHHYERAKD